MLAEAIRSGFGLSPASSAARSFWSGPRCLFSATSRSDGLSDTATGKRRCGDVCLRGQETLSPKRLIFLADQRTCWPSARSCRIEDALLGLRLRDGGNLVGGLGAH